MIHQNLAFGNLITTNYLDRLIKQQRILLKTPKEKQEKKLKPRKLFRSISFKMEQHAFLLLTPQNKQKKSQMHLLLPIEKNTLKRLPSKPAPLDAMGKSEKSITSIQGRSSTQRRSSTPFIKIIRRWSEHEIQSEKLKHLNNKAPKSFVQQHLVAKAQAKKKKLNRLKMQYKFLSRLKKNQQKKLRSKTLPLPKQVRITYTRAKTIVDEQNQGPIFPIDDRLNGRINHLIMLKRGVMRRQTCFQMPKKSVLVSKEKLIRYQKQISDQMVKTQQEGDSQMDISPNFDSTRVYQRRVNFSDRKESLKITQKKKKKLLGSLLKKSSHSIITSYISNKGVTLNSEHVQSSFKPLQELLVKKQITTEKSQLQQISSDRSNYKKRPNLLIKLQPYLQRQVIVK